MDKIRIAVEELPELETEVAVSGAVKQQEVGGGICLCIAVGMTVVASL
jgi:O-acetyl-ADP-ribose deacetylase (regulator of RNase III)